MTVVTVAVGEVWLLAQLTADSGLALRNLILGLLGTFVAVVLGVRAFWAWSDEQYGKMLRLVLAAVPVVAFCYFPDASMAGLQSIARMFVGQG